MTRQRSTITKADYDNVAALLKKLRVLPTVIELTPGKTRIELGNGDAFLLPFDQAEVNRGKERWAAEEGAKERLGSASNAQRWKNLPAPAPKPTDPVLTPPPEHYPRSADTTVADVVSYFRKRLKEDRGDMEEECIKNYWAYLGDDENAREFCRLNPKWKGYGKYQWPEGEWHR